VIYTGTTPYKVTAVTNASVAIWSFDNVVGALDTSSFSAVTALPTTPVLSKTASYVVVTGDRGKVINFNTAADSTATLPSAVTMGDGWRVAIRNVHATSQVSIITVGGQTLQGQTSQTLRLQYEGFWIVSDGANWHIDGHSVGFMTGRLPVFSIVDRDLTTPPVSPDPGARYIIAGIGGAWSTFTIGDIAEADGQGGWFRYSPSEGYLAWLQDENITVQYIDTGTVWRGVSGTPLLASGSAAAAATMDIVLTAFTAFRGVIIKIYGVVPGTDSDDIQMLFSTDGGGSYIGSGYNTARSSNIEGTVTDVGSGSAAFITVAINVGSGANEGYNGSFEILNQTSGTFWPRVVHSGYFINATGTPAGVHVTGGASNETAQDVNAVRFLMSTGTITGSYAVYGLV
jgi:hypothetical protein